jgi:hypothetical protein
LHQLNESFETVHGAKLIGCIDLRARSGDFQRVALVLFDGLDRCSGVVDIDDEPGGPDNASSSMTQAGDNLDASHRAIDRVREAGIGNPLGLK